jgi:hypothetical protein
MIIRIFRAVIYEDRAADFKKKGANPPASALVVV